MAATSPNDRAAANTCKRVVKVILNVLLPSAREAADHVSNNPTSVASHFLTLAKGHRQTKG